MKSRAQSCTQNPQGTLTLVLAAPMPGSCTGSGGSKKGAICSAVATPSLHRITQCCRHSIPFRFTQICTDSRNVHHASLMQRHLFILCNNRSVWIGALLSPLHPCTDSYNLVATPSHTDSYRSAQMHTDPARIHAMFTIHHHQVIVICSSHAIVAQFGLVLSARDPQNQASNDGCLH